MVEHDLLPKTIDAQVSTATEVHVAITASNVTAVNKLFVFLPGTQGVPAMYKLILQSGASRGFHTLGLNYPDAEAVGVLCAGSSDVDCFWNVRRETILGQDFSSLVSVSGPDSIVTRLTEALGYLNQNFPSEGWGQYLSNGTVNWSKVVLGGHSQGGGHVGVMTKLYSLSRACYFASPPDWDGTVPANWESKTNMTPASLQFGFGGLSDPSVPPDQLGVIWQTLGLSAFGAAVQVDSNVNGAPFGNSHMLTTNAQPDTSTTDPGQPYHGLTVRDAFTPKTSSGAPLFDPVWGYLCFR